MRDIDNGLDLEPQFLLKTDTSVTGNCPAAYRADNGGQAGFVIQGKNLSGGTMAKLRDLGGDEDAVWVPADILERLKELL